MNGVPVFAIILLIIGLAVLIGLNIHLSMKVKILERKYRRFMRGKDAVSLEKAFAEKFAEMEKIDRFSKSLRGEIRELRAIEKRNFTKYGILKYDAFEDVGGRLSFVLALLNDEDSGVVLNAIHSRDNCFLYLKEIVNGESYIMLSDEEVKALQAAKRYDSEEDEKKVTSTVSPIIPDLDDGNDDKETSVAESGKEADGKADAVGSASPANEDEDEEIASIIREVEESRKAAAEEIPEEITEDLPEELLEDLDDFDAADPEDSDLIPREWQSASDEEDETPSSAPSASGEARSSVVTRMTIRMPESKATERPERTRKPIKEQRSRKEQRSSRQQLSSKEQRLQREQRQLREQAGQQEKKAKRAYSDIEDDSYDIDEYMEGEEI